MKKLLKNTLKETEERENSLFLTRICSYSIILAMTKIARDPGRGAKPPRKVLCVSSEGLLPVNEIQKDPRREGSLTMGTVFPVGKHEYLLRLMKLEEMAKCGDTRPAMNEAYKRGIDTSDAAKFIASGAVKQELHLEEVFPNIKTLPPKFLPNRARE